MKLILPLSSLLIHCHIIKSAHMTDYLMSMKPPLRLTLVCLFHRNFFYRLCVYPAVQRSRVFQC
jgi:hypothetical protein